MNRRGERPPIQFPDGPFGHPMFSPDGNSLVAERDFSIWTIDLLRGTSTRVATGPRMGWPIWSADGKRIICASERSGPWQIWSRAADGSDEERQIAKVADYSMTPSAVSPDGTEGLLHSDRKESGTDVEVVDAGGTIRSLVRSDADDNPGTFSPDGNGSRTGRTSRGRMKCTCGRVAVNWFEEIRRR